jgi:hypothetical protein
LVVTLGLLTVITNPSVAQDTDQEKATDLFWDKSGNPGPYNQDNLPQYKRTCGDDPNEYLIREHIGNSDEFNPDASENHRWICADRPTDCAFNGRIYSQGQAVDLDSKGEESGNAISELEVCLDDDPSVPGGEWYDLDDDRLTTDNLNPEQVSKLTRVHPDRPTLDRLWDSNPGTDRSRAPTGYATEDDCDPDLRACDDDSGFSSSPWFSAGAFTEGSRQDNNLNSNSFGGIHNKLQESSNQFEPFSETYTYLQDAYSDTPWTNNELDTTPGPDNWGLSDTLTDSITNTGLSKSSGQCHFRPGNPPRTSLSDPSDRKVDKYFGNSYADVRDVDSDGTDEGVWEDPDDISPSKTTFSCDLTRDRGIGYDKAGSNTYRENSKVYVGDITFQGGESDPARGLEHPVCGDDESEYFIESIGGSAFSGTKDGQYACTNSFDFCVEPNPSGPKLFQTGEYTNVDEPRETKGRFKQDDEICLNPSSGPTGDTLHGVWYDQDFGDVDGDGDQETCNTNTLYGAPGVRWFSEEDVRKHPYAVKGGIDDDYNQFLEDKGVPIRDSNATLDDTQEPEFDTSTESPVESGTNTSKLATLGFCGGDDGSEYLASQVCRTDICVSDRSHLGVAKEPGSCVYDGTEDEYDNVPQPVDEDKHKRMLYNNGDQITLGYERQQTITCVDGQWFEKGPIVFDRSQKNISLGSDATASFRVINLGDLETEYEVTLNKETEAEKFSTIEDEQSPSFNVDVPPKESRNFEVRIRGIRENLEDSEDSITVTAEAVNADKEGSDSLEVSIVDENQAGSQRQADEEDQNRNIPGITAIEILLLLMLSTALYTRI